MRFFKIEASWNPFFQYRSPSLLDEKIQHEHCKIDRTDQDGDSTAFRGNSHLQVQHGKRVAMKISGGWINCVLMGSGPYNYNDLQEHTWHMGSTPRDIDNTFQPIHATWSVSGNGSKEYMGTFYSWIRQVLGADAPLQVWIAQDNMVHLARTTTGWNYPDGVTGTQTPAGGQPMTDGYPQPEIALPSMLTQWSPNLTGSFAWPYTRVSEIKIGGRIYRWRLPNRGVRDPNPVSTGWLWEPGPDSSGTNPCHYLGLWHWEIDFA